MPGLRWHGWAHGAGGQRALAGRLLGCGSTARRLDGGRGSAAGRLGGPAASGLRGRRFRRGSTAGGLAEEGVGRGAATRGLDGVGRGPSARRLGEWRLRGSAATGGFGGRRFGSGAATQDLTEERVGYGPAARRFRGRHGSAPGRFGVMPVRVRRRCGSMPVRVGGGAAAGRLHRRRGPKARGRSRRCGAATGVGGTHGLLGAVRPRGRLLADRGRRRRRPASGRGRRGLTRRNRPRDVGSAVLLHQVRHTQAATALCAASTTGRLLFLGFLGTS